MVGDAPFPITLELLRAHPVYQRAQTILAGWHTERLKAGPLSLTEWRQAQLDILELIDSKSKPDDADWFFTTGRALTAKQLLFELVRCTYHEEADERMAAWRILQHTVKHWDATYANDLDVA